MTGNPEATVNLRLQPAGRALVRPYAVVARIVLRAAIELVVVALAHPGRRAAINVQTGHVRAR